MDTYGFPLSALTEADQATRQVRHSLWESPSLGFKEPFEASSLCCWYADGLLLCVQRALARDRKVAKDWDPKALPTWQPDLSDAPSAVPRKLRLLVRKGIPQELRPQLWLQFSGGLALRSHSPEGHYKALVEAAPKLTKTSLLQLSTAVSKTFPGLKMLGTATGNEAVRRLAMAYSQHTHKSSLVGDSSLLCLIAFLLAVVGLEREEDAFWTLVGLVDTRLSSLALFQVGQRSASTVGNCQGLDECMACPPAPPPPPPPLPPGGMCPASGFGFPKFACRWSWTDT